MGLMNARHDMTPLHSMIGFGDENDRYLLVFIGPDFDGHHIGKNKRPRLLFFCAGICSKQRLLYDGLYPFALRGCKLIFDIKL
jgi:hypothetical protein